MKGMPSEHALDSTLALKAEGYRFISNRCRAHRSDVFEARLLLRPTICMRGRDAAALFYDPSRFERAGAAPARVKRTLFGEGGVQGLDGDAHRERKAVFLALLAQPRVETLVDRVRAEWAAAAARWRTMPRVQLLGAAREVLARAVCGWAGVPLREAEVAQRTADLGAMIEGGAAIGPAHWRARRARNRAEAWIAGLVADVRAGRGAPPPEDSALAAFALHRDASGARLPVHTAAVEVLNVLRPTVAIARYIVFSALAMHDDAGCAERIGSGDALFTVCFVHEVRRYYPFFPFAGARVRTSFEWNDMRFAAGRRVLLDLYGTNHDERLWDEPDRFRPERFARWDGDAYAFVPQGGGEHASGHRCAGEWATIAILREVCGLLAGGMSYRVPPQDLRVDLASVPARPASGMVLADVRPR